MKIIILVLMLLSLFFIGLTIYFSIFQLIKKKEYEKIKFLSEYKKGRFFLIYISSFLINYANALFRNGYNIVKNITFALKQTVESVVLKVEFSNIETFYNSNILYKVVFILFIIVLIINAILFVLSLIYPYILRYNKNKEFLKSQDKIIFIGWNEEVLRIVNTIDRNISKCLIIDEINKNDSELLLGKKIAYKIVKNQDIYEIDKVLSKIIKESKFNKYKIIIHTQDEDKNLIITRKINDVMEEYRNTHEINTYVLGYGDSQTIFNSYVEKSQGRIRYINKYHLIASDFVDRYPITKFMNGNHIDYNTATIKDDVNINIYMIGYGKTNQELFLTSVANNQFITLKNDIPIPKRINYYIYDKNNSKSNKNLNHYYYRLENEENYFKGREKEFLPLDVKPAEIITPHNRGESIDINDPKFYQYLHQDIKNTKENDINYIIVSFGSKIENLDMADKLASKIHEWDIEKQTKVFVRVNDSKFIDSKSMVRTIENYKQSSDNYSCGYKGGIIEIPKLNKVNEEEQLYYTFGEEDIIIFNIEKIFNNKEEIIAKNRDAVYSLKQDESLSEDKLDKVYKKWYTKTQIQRDSNYYAYLSIRTKLNLLGLDYIDEKLYDSNIHTIVSFEEFYNIYLKNSNAKIDYQKTFNYNNQSLTRIVYKTELDTPSCIRTYLGMQEHLRWNAYTISKGVVQSTIKDIMTSLDDGKDYKITRKHNCITTFEGLKELRYLLSIKQFISDEFANKCGSDNNVSFKQKACELMETDFELWKHMFDNLPKEKQEEYLINNDVINYDYQILDDLEWLFKISGFVIIKK